MKKLVCAVAAVLLFILSTIPVFAEEVDVSAQAYVLYCADNGKVLLSQNSDKELPIASTTKIMTTLLTLEAASVQNRVVEFTDEMTAQGSSMYLKKGEKVRLYDLAVGMMMQSGNDAANAAAFSIGGSLDGFAKMMNQKAREIGMEHTHFVTPSGLDEDAHYSCAYDMAVLMAYAMKNKDFAHITSQTSMEIRFVYPADKFMTYPNHNKLLRMYDSCIGGKTGYTDKAGRCLVTAARSGGMTLIAVTLDDRNDWSDHVSLYRYGFSHYQTKMTVCDDVTRTVVGGDADFVTLKADSTTLVLPSDAPDLQERLYLPPFVYAPVKYGETLGKVVYSCGGEVLGEAPLKTCESVGYNDKKRSFITYLKDLFNWHS